MGAFLFWAHRRGIRTRQGAELRKHEAFSSAAREERSDEAGRGRRQPHADIPHRPPPNWKRSSQGDRFCLVPAHGIRTRQGAELRKREAFSSAAREGRRPEAKAGGVSRTRHPSSPTTELLGLQRWRPFLFQAQCRRIRTHQHVCHKGRGQIMAKMSTATLLATYKKIAFA